MLDKYIKDYSEAIRYEVGDSPPFHAPDYVAKQAVNLKSQDHPLASLFEHAKENGEKIYGNSLGADDAVKARQEGKHEDEHPNYSTSEHDIGDGVTAKVSHRPLSDSPGFSYVKMQLHHPETGRTGVMDMRVPSNELEHLSAE